MGNKIQRIYVGSNQVRPHNRIVYFPLENDILDHGPNHVNMTEYQTKSFSTLSSGKKVLYSSNGWGMLSANNFVSTYLNSHEYTVRLWASITKSASNRRNYFFIVVDPNAWRSGVEAAMTARETNQGGYDQIYYVRGGTNGLVGSTAYNGWHHIVATYNNGTVKAYINGNLYQTVSTYNISDGYLCVGDDSAGDGLHGYMSEFLIDGGIRTDSEITKDYNQTKSNYGL